jgi:phage-related protein
MAYDICVLRPEEFRKFVSNLDSDVKARVVRDIDFLKENGARLTMPYAKKIDKELWELRTSGKQKVRIVYSIKKDQIYIIHWFIKKSQKMPLKELNTAIRRLTDI